MPSSGQNAQRIVDAAAAAIMLAIVPRVGRLHLLCVALERYHQIRTQWERTVGQKVVRQQCVVHQAFRGQLDFVFVEHFAELRGTEDTGSGFFCKMFKVDISELAVGVTSNQEQDDFVRRF